jgi:crooked neck
MEKVEGMMPIVSKKRRKVDEAGDMEEECAYNNLPITWNFTCSVDLLMMMTLGDADWDMVFADDERESNPASFKFLEMAHKWKKLQVTGSSAASTLLAPPKAAEPPPTSDKPSAITTTTTTEENADKDDDSDMASSDGED